MLQKVLKTPVDDLVELVRNNENCSVLFLKEKLGLSLSIIEKWLVILEEFKILKVQYKGLEGFVSLKRDKFVEEKNDDKLNISKIKDTFISSSKLKGLSYDKIKGLWPIFVNENESKFKKIFEEKGKLNKLNSLRINKSWIKFKQELEDF